MMVFSGELLRLIMYYLFKNDGVWWRTKVLENDCVCWKMVMLVVFAGGWWFLLGVVDIWWRMMVLENKSLLENNGVFTTVSGE